MPKGDSIKDIPKKDYWKTRVKPKLEMVTGWARNGATDSQIYMNLGIGETTWYRFLNEHEELSEALRLGREDAEVAVENALFKRAVGYRYNEVYRERKKVLDEDGEWTGEWELIVTKKVTKHVQPDVNAQTYWLEHRAPKRWEKNPTPGVDAGIVNEAIQSLAQLLANPVKERAIGSENE